MRLPAWITARPIAHRGLFDAARGIPENSLAAVRAAVDAGYPMEIDLRAAADGVAVFHDQGLKRMTGRDGAIGKMTRAELKGVRLSGTGETIPMLEEVLDLVAGRVPLMLEIKNDGVAGAIEESILQRLGNYRGEIAVVSFNPFSLAWFASRGPHIARGQTAASLAGSGLAPWRRFLQRNLLLNVVSRPDFILYDLSVLPYWAVSWRRRFGAKVVAYTARSRAEAIKARTVADNFIFESIRP